MVRIQEAPTMKNHIAVTKLKHNDQKNNIFQQFLSLITIISQKKKKIIGTMEIMY